MDTFRIAKYDYFPWSNFPCSQEGGVKDIVSIGYNTYKIKDFSAFKTGNIPVELYDGECFEDAEAPAEEYEEEFDFWD